MTNGSSKKVLELFLDELQDKNAKLLLESYVKDSETGKLKTAFKCIVDQFTALLDQEVKKDEAKEHNH